MIKRITSIALCLSMIITMGVWIPGRVYADESENEYIVVVDSDSGYEDLLENYEDEIIETSENTSILNDQNTVVLSVTDSEAAEIQQDVASSMNSGFSIITYYTQVRFSGESLSDTDKEWFRLRAARINQDGLWHTVSSNKAALIDASIDYDSWRDSEYVGP